jgi:hypothetical protein
MVSPDQFGLAPSATDKEEEMLSFYPAEKPK